MRKALSSANLSQNQWQLFIAAVARSSDFPPGQTIGWPKNLKGKSEKQDHHRRFWQFLTYSWGSRRPCTCRRSCKYPGKTRQALSSHPCLTLRFCVCRKWRLRQSCKLPEHGRQVLTHKAPIRRRAGRPNGLDHFRKSVKSSADDWALISSVTEAEASVTPHDKEWDCRNRPGKSLNKQQQQAATITTSEDEEEGNVITRVTTILKIPSFGQKVMTRVKKE